MKWNYEILKAKQSELSWTETEKRECAKELQLRGQEAGNEIYSDYFERENEEKTKDNMET